MAVREMTTAFFALATAFVITAAAAPGFIPLLRKMKFGQEVRDDGPQSHLKKQGTPTMGGIIFVSAAAIASAAAMLIPNPLCLAGDQTRIPALPRRC